MSAALGLGQGLIPGQGGYPDRALGLQFAFTGREVSYLYGGLSPDGYLYPDNGSQVFIGFSYGSAALNQRVPYDYGPKYYLWVLDFFDGALNQDISVNQALDRASLINYGVEFLSSPLRVGFTSYWEYFDPQEDCVMAVYGDGNIRLKNFDASVHSVGRPTTYGPTSGQPNTQYTFTTSAADSYGHDIRYIFDWGDGTNTTTGYFADGEKVSESHSWSSDGEKTVTVTAQCENGAYCSGMSYNTIDIESYHWLFVGAYDAYLGINYPLSPHVWIDGNPVGTAPINVNITAGVHTIEVDYETYDPYWPATVQLVSFMGDYQGYYGSTGVWVDVTQDTSVGALYFWA